MCIEFGATATFPFGRISLVMTRPLWVTDIAEHPTREGKRYRSVVLAACS